MVLRCVWSVANAVETIASQPMQRAIPVTIVPGTFRALATYPGDPLGRMSALEIACACLRDRSVVD